MRILLTLLHMRIIGLIMECVDLLGLKRDYRLPAKMTALKVSLPPELQKRL